jgi:hypothetical protein
MSRRFSFAESRTSPPLTRACQDVGAKLRARDRGAVAQQACEYMARQPRRPTPSAPCIPNGPNAPRERSQDEEGDAVAEAALAAAGPCHPPRGPASNAEQGWPKTPRAVRGHRQEAQEGDRAGEWARRRDGRAEPDGHATGLPRACDTTLARAQERADGSPARSNGSSAPPDCVSQRREEQITGVIDARLMPVSPGR